MYITDTNYMRANGSCAHRDSTRARSLIYRNACSPPVYASCNKAQRHPQRRPQRCHDHREGRKRAADLVPTKLDKQT